MTKLPGVTVCAVDCVSPSLAVAALEKSASRLDFAEVLFFSDTPIQFGGNTVKIEKLTSRNAYSEFILRRLVEFIRTPFVLIVQWDGFVIEPRRWRDEFLRVDYIGATWGWYTDGMTVGNGGFSLRSRKIMEACANFCGPSTAVEENEDTLICRSWRGALEARYGIVFGSHELASQFSYERSLPDQPTFGFHGLFNLWRHVDDSRLLETIRELPTATVRGIEYIELMLVLLTQKKFQLTETMFQRVDSVMSDDEIIRKINIIVRDSQLSSNFLSSLRRL